VENTKQLEIKEYLVYKITQIKQKMGLDYITTDELIEMIFIGGLYLLEYQHEEMIEFIKSNALLDN